LQALELFGERALAGRQLAQPLHRSLTGEEPDEKKERTSRSATAADSSHIPAALLPGATGTGPKVRYPTWDELTGLTPEQRRMVLEYFRRLNEPKH